MATRAKKPPKRGNPFTPFVAPTRPPAGFYDPALDAQQASATRGLQDLSSDTALAGRRGQDDLFLAEQRIGTETGNALTDILTTRSRGTEDYQYATGERKRQYGILANNQLQGAAASGLTGGGALVQGARKRRENEGREQAQADRGYQRFLTDSQTGEKRIGDAKSNALADLALGYQRGSEDRSTGLVRAQRENTFFSTDLDAQRWFQSSQMGYAAPEKQANENTRNGVTYRRLSDGRAKLPDGRIVSAAQLRKLLARGA